MFAILSAGLAPTIGLLSYFYLKDKVTEPLSLIVRTFILGALLVFPIMFLQYAFAEENVTNNPIIQSFFLIAFFEEFFKWFIFMFSMYRHPEFNNHYDGIVYAVSISLGFATVENILYLITNGIEYALFRAVFPVSSHALFGVIMGYYLGKAKVMPEKSNWNKGRALFAPFLLHGIYNYILISIKSNWIYYLFPFMIALWFLALRRAKKANQW
ncbi:PrsW family intramembrane metalloprotease [Oceanobacillus piezotolerans]|uniref:Protease PrsW n=1 Tax=Oceanobacillus piezotolerans TaxID=2448030 RepID=A0A498DTJ4_9BACI|nr:glutamic-type intramembrane protease PrsW [Oceanobacillus piezotolerans]RLL48187.1 PrsW family intramembrane metalloprotease [Oceanobacillus piezotolerans]